MAGGVARSGSFRPLKRHMKERLSPFFARIAVKRARFENAGVIGCAALAFRYSGARRTAR